ncbi:MAG: hypothetical protein JWP81_4998 [Ferruginibacter sp.]|nr:hypothetical protein [Ferruginibacter sp.]
MANLTQQFVLNLDTIWSNSGFFFREILADNKADSTKGDHLSNFYKQCFCISLP